MSVFFRVKGLDFAAARAACGCEFRPRPVGPGEPCFYDTAGAEKNHPRAPGQPKIPRVSRQRAVKKLRHSASQPGKPWAAQKNRRRNPRQSEARGRMPASSRRAGCGGRAATSLNRIAQRIARQTGPGGAARAAGGGRRRRCRAELVCAGRMAVPRRRPRPRIIGDDVGVAFVAWSRPANCAGLRCLCALLGGPVLFLGSPG